MPLCITCHGRAALHSVTHPGASPVPCPDCNGTGQVYADATEPLSWPIVAEPKPKVVDEKPFVTQDAPSRAPRGS